MKTDLTPEIIRQLRVIHIEGVLTAAEASKAFSISPETVRRLWRGETHRTISPTLSLSAEESLARIMAGAAKPEPTPGDTE